MFSCQVTDFYGISHKVKILTLILPFLLASSIVNAGEFHLNATSLGQVRKNARLQKEIPVNGYLGMAFAQPTWELSGETNMRVIRDFKRKLDDYDLYQAVIHYKPTEKLRIDSGRQIVNQGFSLEMLDGVQTTIMPWDHVDFTVYSGIPRSVEREDFNKNDGLLTGISIGMKNVARTNFSLHAAWRKNDIYFIDPKQNDEARVGANFSHQFAVSTTPMLYGTFEYDAMGKVIDTGVAGFDIYPSKRIALNMEFNYFNISRETDRLTIQRLFTQGRQIGGRFSSTWTLVPNYLDLVESYTYQNVEVVKGDRRHGHIVDAALQLSLDNIGLHIEPGYYFSKSFGGRLHGGRISIHEQFTDKFYTEVGFDFTKYKKITNDNDNAYSGVGWAGYEVAKGLTISGGFEYNKNNSFNKDARGSFRLDYQFDHGS
ncbi:MAG: hypothetical protein A3F82_06240 [Deltaproteobacteria bacterium RIFCSPLOWO2_12_FULL_44_12]|nr:MAG: hypothetical protein A2712_01065 [Deltaproteobacteria bacterium RIFCSPHIGHO2_01_FULL_43_49]OGQ15273.1 MAG: hypothetical protein A3D22_04410 [Deltaproteobacteria bacterium RIFCSPHIGHO2_02_FULL_44_53]OGQ27103.1 MAG: hypothetical protein A3D98_01655 [Deltaproteobacteria bacterium RIFCSPHIGHO2_12_FULL_44_21]OGQ31789.1 MAG: hypothetical protein A2979_05570 [Deltaproteobacteria bacterium RIFCSPLOWO2_01_FULL_45_74]OGQ42991.1 MAG: hypothetical protein A3I70_07875 [Deltaproteobacteria bacterium 